ncbi:C-C motif chemokine 24 [Grammomys surdaster]|uniref:C-C motif chemokine 24 n=1 Tax=Grammomys surdaster TaxID=491861 RepID=UPI0010A06BE2|nr:C-C motif chemokine 24 [Grammomys surdaster]XP_028622083.1 C-C motif chemokine 24 [Grammomys surdaster]
MADSTMIVASLFLLVTYMCCICPTDSVTIPSSCCISFISKKIPENRVVSYQLANGSICPKAGVIFITKKGHKICTDPKLPWVQRHIQHLDAKKNQPSKGAKALGPKVAVQKRHGNSTKI